MPSRHFQSFFAVLVPAKFQADVYVRAHVHVRKRERVLFFIRCRERSHTQMLIFFLITRETLILKRDTSAQKA